MQILSILKTRELDNKIMFKINILREHEVMHPKLRQTILVYSETKE